MIWRPLRKSEHFIKIECFVHVEGRQKMGGNWINYEAIPISFTIDDKDTLFWVEKDFEKLKKKIVEQAIKELRKEVRQSKKKKGVK